MSTVSGLYIRSIFSTAYCSYTESPPNYILTLPVVMDTVENAADVAAYEEKVKLLEGEVKIATAKFVL